MRNAGQIFRVPKRKPFRPSIRMSYRFIHIQNDILIDIASKQHCPATIHSDTRHRIGKTHAWKIALRRGSLGYFLRQTRFHSKGAQPLFREPEWSYQFRIDSKQNSAPAAIPVVTTEITNVNNAAKARNFFMFVALLTRWSWIRG